MAFIAGQSAPPGKQMGHAGAIISGSSGSAKEKIESLEAAGIRVAQEPSDIPKLLKDKLPKRKKDKSSHIITDADSLPQISNYILIV